MLPLQFSAVLLLIQVKGFVYGWAAEETLHEYLFRNYDKNLLPAVFSVPDEWPTEWPITVEYSLALQTLRQSDKPSSTGITQMDLNVLLFSKWKDPNLVWEPYTYDELEKINIPVSKIWNPDVTMFENAQWGVRPEMLSAQVSSSGLVILVSGLKMQMDCTWDTSNTYCMMSARILSWSYDTLQVNLTTNANGQVDMTEYTTNPDFQITEIKVYRNERKYSCCPEPHYDITYNFTVRRTSPKRSFQQSDGENSDRDVNDERSGRTARHIDLSEATMTEDSEISEAIMTEYSGISEATMTDDSEMPDVSFSMVMPAIIVSVLTPVQFLLPPDAKQRITVCSILLVTLVVGFSSVLEYSDGSSTAAAIVRFYNLAMMWTTLTLLLSVITLHVCRNSPTRRPMPTVIKKIFLTGMSRLVCVTIPEEDVAKEDTTELTEKQEMGTGTVLEHQVNVILNTIRESTVQQIEKKKWNNDWYLLVFVIDRIMCVVFSVIFVVSAVALFA